MYSLYILRTSGNTLYTGIAKNLEKRLAVHRLKNNKSSKYVRSFSSFELVYEEKLASRSLALKRESEIKKLTRFKKESLIKSYELLERNELL